MVIYKTTNLLNGKFYIGKDEKNNPEYLGSGKILKQSISKHGVEQFKKEILEKIYGKYYEKDYFKGRCLSVHINKIRKYLIKNKLNYQIKTISKSGFILEKLNKNILTNKIP